MNARQVIEQIDQIYDRFLTPWFLQEHMRTTAAVAKFMMAHWTGPELNEDAIVAALLIHDLGNVMYVHRGSLSELYELTDEELDAIEERQKIFSKKYGTKAKEVTQNMWKELELEKDLMHICLSREISDIEALLDKDDWNVKIACYPDLVVAPTGVVSRQERYEDILARYGHRADEICARTPFVEKFEKQLFEHLSITPEDITATSVAPFNT